MDEYAKNIQSISQSSQKVCQGPEMRVENYIDKFDRKEGTDKTRYLARLQRKAECGKAAAMVVVGFILVRERLTDRKKYQEGLAWLEKAAFAGEAAAYSLLGEAVEEDCASPTAPIRAFRWYRRGAALGDVKSTCRLGRCYLLGSGCKRNLCKASKYLMLAANGGSLEAAYDMGVLTLAEGREEFFDRYLVEKGLHAECDELLTEAFLFGNEEQLLENTNPETYPTALQWFTKSGGCGRFLSGMLLQKMGKLRQAVSIFRRGVKCDDWECAHEFALCCIYGDGIEPDPQTGYDILFEHIVHPRYYSTLSCLESQAGEVPQDPRGRSADVEFEKCLSEPSEDTINN